MLKKIDCDECRDTYEGGYNEYPPCGPKRDIDYDQCPWLKVKLLKENREAWDIYRRIIGQRIIDPFGNQTLNIMPIYETMDRMEIPEDDQLELLDMIIEVDRKVIERLRRP